MRNLAELQVSLMAYAVKEVIPHLPQMTVRVAGFQVPVSASLLQFGAGLGAGMSAINLERYAPQLQAIGVLDANNMVDEQKLVQVMRSQMEALGKVNLGPVDFDVSDVDKFAGYL